MAATGPPSPPERNSPRFPANTRRTFRARQDDLLRPWSHQQGEPIMLRSRDVLFSKWTGRIRLAGLAVVLGLASPILHADPALSNDKRSGADPRDLHHCALRSRHATRDISFHQTRPAIWRTVPVPRAVARSILDRATADAKSISTADQWRESRVDCALAFYYPAFEVNGPAGLRLYAAPRYFPVENSVDYLVMFDPRSGVATRSPLLIVQERVHNGTAYDAAIDRYFEIGKDMALTQGFAVEARAIYDWGRQEYTERKATFLTPNRVRIDVTLQAPGKAAARGGVLLERDRAGQPFHVARRMPARGHAADDLVTTSDTAKSDDDFLRVGCDFYY